MADQILTNAFNESGGIYNQADYNKAFGYPAPAPAPVATPAPAPAPILPSGTFSDTFDTLTNEKPPLAPAPAPPLNAGTPPIAPAAPVAAIPPALPVKPIELTPSKPLEQTDIKKKMMERRRRLFGGSPPPLGLGG